MTLGVTGPECAHRQYLLFTSAIRHATRKRRHASHGLTAEYRWHAVAVTARCASHPRRCAPAAFQHRRLRRCKPSRRLRGSCRRGRRPVRHGFDRSGSDVVCFRRHPPPPNAGRRRRRAAATVEKDRCGDRPPPVRGAAVADVAATQWRPPSWPSVGPPAGSDVAPGSPARCAAPSVSLWRRRRWRRQRPRPRGVPPPAGHPPWARAGGAGEFTLHRRSCGDLARARRTGRRRPTRADAATPAQRRRLVASPRLTQWTPPVGSPATSRRARRQRVAKHPRRRWLPSQTRAASPRVVGDRGGAVGPRWPPHANARGA